MPAARRRKFFGVLAFLFSNEKSSTMEHAEIAQATHKLSIGYKYDTINEVNSILSNQTYMSGQLNFLDL